MKVIEIEILNKFCGKSSSIDGRVPQNLFRISSKISLNDKLLKIIIILFYIYHKRNCYWNADDIDNILKTLQDNNTKITFFMVGDWIEKFPDAVKKIQEAGHEIASHSDTHPHVNNLSYEKNIEEIEKSNDKIEKIAGKGTKIYRPPYGEYNDTVIKAAQDKGYFCIQWNLDTLDYTGLTGEDMWKRLEGKIKAGDIILSHNGTKHTADSLDMLLKKIKQKGLEVVTVSDLIYFDNYTINSNGTQVKK